MPLQETSLEDLVGCAGYEGPIRSLEDMEAAIARAARETADAYSRSPSEAPVARSSGS
jgi:hypothetical protein